MLRFFRVPIIILNGLCKWFAVPLSATQAPVTGLTDILTPVNLLPNSDFSRSGGITSPITYTESEYIDENKSIIHNNCTWEDAGSTRNGTEFNLKGYIIPSIASTDSGSVYVGINSSYGDANWLKANTIYTGAVKCKKNSSDNDLTIAVSNRQTANTIDRSVPELNNDWTESFIITSSEVKTKFWFVITLKGTYSANERYYIDVSIKDLRIFEGAYLNPPVGRSIDTGNQPMFVGLNRGGFTGHEKTAGMPVQPIRMITTPSNASSYKQIYIRLSTAYLTYGGARHIFVAYLYEIMGTQYSCNVFRRYLIKIMSRNYVNTVSIRHKEIIYQSDFSMQFPGNEQNPVYNDYILTWDWDASYISGQTSVFVIRGTATHIPPNTYYAIQPIFIEGDNNSYVDGYPHFTGSQYSVNYSS